MFFCTSWMHLRKHCWIVTAKVPKIYTHSPRKTLNLWKKYLCTQKMKNRFFSGEVFLKVWEFSAQNREMKKHFLWKKYQIVLLRTYLAVLRKQPDFFCSNFDKKCSCSRENFEESRKNKYAVFPILDALSKTLLKTFLLEPEYLSLQSEKQPKSPGK